MRVDPSYITNLVGSLDQAQATEQQLTSESVSYTHLLGEFASEALGRALSERGGFGMATSIVRDLSQTGNNATTTQVTGKLHGNTVMKTLE